VITFGQTESDNTNRMITIINEIYFFVLRKWTLKRDHIKWVSTLNSVNINQWWHKAAFIVLTIGFLIFGCEETSKKSRSLNVGEIDYEKVEKIADKHKKTLKFKIFVGRSEDLKDEG